VDDQVVVEFVHDDLHAAGKTLDRTALAPAHGTLELRADGLAAGGQAGGGSFRSALTGLDRPLGGRHSAHLGSLIREQLTQDVGDVCGGRVLHLVYECLIATGGWYVQFFHPLVNGFQCAGGPADRQDRIHAGHGDEPDAAGGAARVEHRFQVLGQVLCLVELDGDELDFVDFEEAAVQNLDDMQELA